MNRSPSVTQTQWYGPQRLAVGSREPIWGYGSAHPLEDPHGLMPDWPGFPLQGEFAVALMSRGVLCRKVEGVQGR